MGMSRRKKAVAIKIVTASIVAGMFVFFTIIVPEHLAEFESHDHCISCQIIQHAPLLEPEAKTDVAPLLQREGLLYISGDAASFDPQLTIPLYRAPPFFDFS